MSKTNFLLILSILVLPLIISGQAQASQGNTILDGYVRQALENNPDLLAARARWQMYENKTVQAGALDDPVLSLALVNYPIDNFSDDDTPMTGKDIKLSQKFPFPGKRGSKSEMADQQALWFKGVFEDARLQTAQKVKDAFYRLFYQQKAIQITEKNTELLDDFIRLTEKRYEVGKGLQQDVLKAQVERSKLIDRLLELKQRKQSSVAALNTLIGRSTHEAVEIPEQLHMSSVDLGVGELQRLSEQNRPLYAAYRALVDKFQAQKKLARLNHYPDFNLWAGYRLREDSAMDPVDGEDFVSTGISITLPVYRGKRKEAVTEAEAGIQTALRQYDDFRSRVHFSIHDAYARLESSRDQSLLFETGIIPQAQQSFQATLSAYQVDRVDFLALLDSLLTLYRYQIDYYRVFSEHERSAALLEANSGMKLSTASGNVDNR